MGLTVLGKEDLDTLQHIVMDRFVGVENKQLDIPEWTQPPFSEPQCGTITHIVPVKDIRKLVVTWGIPDLASQFRAGPGSYLSHLVGHEGPGSLLSQLRASGWAIGLTAGTRVGGKGFSFFYVSIDLTEEGIDHVDDSIHVVFQYLRMLKTSGPKERIFQEIKDLRKMRFHFKDKESPREYVRMLAKDLHAYPLPEVLSGGWLLSDWQPGQITSLLDRLTPSLARVTVVGRCFAYQCEREEQWYGAKYSLRCIPKEQKEAWASAPLHNKLHLPDPNEFIPTDFSIAPRDVDATDNHPSVLHEDEFSRLWFKQDNEYLLPKTCITLLLRSPLAYLDPHHVNLTHMLAVMFQDQTNEKLYAASLAGLSHSMSATKSGLLITLRGYNNKQAILLERIIDLLLTFEVDEARFPALKDAYQRKLKNFSAEQPQQHTAYHTSLLLTENIWEKAELLEALDQMSVPALNLFLPQLLSSIHVETLVFGNSCPEAAMQLNTRMVDKLKGRGCRPLLPCQMVLDREVEMAKGVATYCATNNIHRSSACENYYQTGARDTRANMELELFGQVIKERCFTQLRTKEQLGYIVKSLVRRSNGAQGIKIVVQSEWGPKYLDARIEAFIAGLEESIEQMEES